MAGSTDPSWWEGSKEGVGGSQRGGHPAGTPAPPTHAVGSSHPGTVDKGSPIIGSEYFMHFPPPHVLLGGEMLGDQTNGTFCL